MAGRRWLNRETFGWAMFDFANQAFTLVILTTMFHLYFVHHLVREDVSLGRRLWATCGIIALLVVILVSPVIGALADFSGAKKRLLFTAYVVSVGFTAALATVAPGQIALGMVLFILGYIFYAIGENFMSAFLPEIATHGNMGRVSAFGWTMGYVGGLLCLAGAAGISAIWEGPTGYRIICLWAAGFYYGAGLVTFALLPERKRREAMPEGQTLATVGFHRLAATFRQLTVFKHLFRFLAIMTFYMAGMQIVIWFAGSIATEIFGLSEAQLAVYIVVLTVTAILGAIVTGRIQDRIGTRRTISIGLVVWLLVMLCIPLVREERKFMFWILGSGVGVGMGILGTSSRAMVGLFTPQHKAAELFGFYGLATKLAAVLGLGVTILAEVVFPDNYKMVVASSSIFFIGGLLLLWLVDEQAGSRVAIESAREHVARHHDYTGEIDGDDPDPEPVA